MKEDMTNGEETGLMRARAEAMVDAALAHLREVDAILGPDLAARLLSDYDTHQRRRRERLSLASFADAFGWRALARPIAAAGLLGSLCAGGFIAGAAATTGGADAYAELSTAIDQSLDFTGEDASWAAE